MKKALSIVFALLILFSGMHLSVATHYCGGERAAVEWSMTGVKATCGMERIQTDCANHPNVTSNCCRDEISMYSVDSNYNLSNFQLRLTEKPLSQDFFVPASLFPAGSALVAALFQAVAPRDKLQVSQVLLERICVFRI